MNKKKRFTTCTCLTTCLFWYMFITVCCFLIYRIITVEKKKNTQEQIIDKDNVSTNSITIMKDSQNADLASLYDFILVGTFDAVSDSDDSVLELSYFTFNRDGSFMGHTSLSEEDVGVYEIYPEDGKMHLIIYGSESTDSYVLNVIDKDTINLQKGVVTYTLDRR